MNISPLKSIPVSYVVLPTDVGPYYVQAVLRDTASGTIIQTINLVQNATYLYRYTGTFKPVPDVSGLGRYVDITVIPYTDTGHTTPSQNYAALQLNYVVLQPWIPTLGAGGGGSIDYDKLRLTIAEVIEETRPKEKEMVEISGVEYERIGGDTRSALSEMLGEFTRVHGTGVGEIKALLGSLREGVDTAGVTSSQTILERIGSIEESLERMNQNGSESSRSLLEEMRGSVKEAKDEIVKSHGEHVKRIDKRMVDVTKESAEGIKKHLSENLGGKEVKFSMNLGGEAPREKNQQGYDMSAVNKLLNLP